MLVSQLKLTFPLYINDRTYVPKAPMEDERMKLWYRSTFISYVLVGKVDDFIGPSPQYIKKPQVLQDFFQAYPG